MYAKYNYTSGATLAQIAADITAILTGETVVANLSAACDYANTEILTTYAVAGWALHDATAHSPGTATMTIASPCVVTRASHSLLTDDKVSFTTTGALPTGVVAGTVYYAIYIDSSTFNIAATPGGAAINTSGSQSGTHTCWTDRKRILKAAVADDAGFYKYAQLDINTAGAFQLGLHEGWNATTHASTNAATAPVQADQQRITVGTAGTMLIAASARFIALQSTTSAGIGSSGSNSWTGLFERSRLAPWDTVAAAYPPSLIFNSRSFGYNTSLYGGKAPRIKYPGGGDATNVAMFPATMGWFGGSTISMYGIGTDTAAYRTGTIKTKVPDGAGGFYTPFTEIQFRYSDKLYSFEGGSISSICDVWNTVSYPNNLDEVVKGSTNYIIWQNSTYATATTHSGYEGDCSANTAFPKG